MLVAFPYGGTSASNSGSQPPPIPFLLLVAMLGTLGAFFSALTRLSPSKNLSTDSFFSYQEYIEDFDGFTFWIYALLRPLTGFIAAIMSGMVAGDIFPHFICHVEDAKGYNHLTSIFDLGPEKAQDYVKALVWGFISGFSERLLPDMLEKFANSAESLTDSRTKT